MKYKIGIVANNVTERDIERAQEYTKEYFDKQTPLDVSFEVINTNEDVRHKVFKTKSDGRKAHGTENGKEITRKVVDLGEYHQVIFCYNLEDTGFEKDDINYVTAWSFWNELSIGTEYTEVPMGRGVGNTWEKQAWVHETMHAIIKRIKRSGIDVTDHMDVTVVDGEEVAYYKNREPYAEDGNHARTLREAAPHWDVVTSTNRADDAIKLIEKLAEVTKRAAELKKVTAPVGFMSEPNHIVFHHGGDARLLTVEEMERIYQETHHDNLYIPHKQPRIPNSTTPDIAYHIIVGKDTWKLVRPLDMYGYHASNFAVNKDSIAICVTGNYSKHGIDPQVEANLLDALDYLKKHAPSAKIRAKHNDYANKECPGTAITDEVIDKWWAGESAIEVVEHVEEVDTREKEALLALLKVLVENYEYLQDFVPAFNEVIKNKLKE